MGRGLALPLAVLAAAAVAAACNTDPVHTNAVNALGPEVAGIPKGEFHRAGQPCATCHGDEGPANTTFSVAGTVFFGPANTSAPVGVGNATVTLEDDTQSRFTVSTNCVGNFFVQPGDWPGHPQFPVLVTISGQPEGSTLTLSMQSHIGRAASCAECHQYPTTDNYFQTPGLVRLSPTDDPNYKGDQTCPVNPVPPGFGGP
jgi:cytochrome c553